MSRRPRHRTKIGIVLMTLSIIACAATVSCASTPSSPPATDGSPGEGEGQEVGAARDLAAGESVDFDGGAVAVTFEGVERDNRCPPEVECFVAGAATVALTVRAGDASVELTVDVPPGGSAVGDALGYRLAVEEVAPMTHHQRVIEPHEYVVTLRVEDDGNRVEDDGNRVEDDGNRVEDDGNRVEDDDR